MSSISIIVTIIVLLAALVCYAFVAQTVKVKREQRNRLLAALKSRSRNFKFMINGFPQGFLPRDLTLLVQKNLIEVSEQLSMLEPKEPAHMQDLQAISSQMTETQRHAKPSAPVTLENPQQIKEVKICLEELHRFIHTLEENSSLSRNQAENYRKQLKQLVLQLTVDGYALQGTAAQGSNKTKLALHYYNLALKLLVREGKPGQFDARIAKLKALHEEMSKKLEEETQTLPNSEEEQAEQEEIANEWDKFDSDKPLWKKKHAYD
ncbi:hypothetical protein [Teredinibacter haidensis]|uniref:hypothetical protein n=1 Tax=Teredinibacter haidensis TaxID=2731755 RepID=UPI000948F4B4|nr:hypothetical protein [Teredinibacter haidensis]